jgi:predicted RNA binding protein YcfA (HicA-like mRNA interferase family)
MSNWKKTREKLLLGSADANMDFEEICVMLRHLGFSERQGHGNHRIFYKEGVTLSTCSRAAARGSRIR